MQYDTIVSITPSGEPPYASAYGLLHSFLVTFASGVQGRVNAKSPSGPPYKAGQGVWYEIQGQTTTGANRIKVDAKTPPPQMPAVAQPLPAPVAQAQAPRPPQTQVPPVTGTPVLEGAESGMLLKLAWEVYEHNANLGKEAVIDLQRLPGDLWEIAMLLKSVSTGLRTGVKPEPQDPF